MVVGNFELLLILVLLITVVENKKERKNLVFDLE
jgi:hypothetical protein